MSSTRKKTKQKKLDRKYSREIRALDSYKASVAINVLADHTCENCFFNHHKINRNSSSWVSVYDDFRDDQTYSGFDRNGNPVEKRKRARKRSSFGCTNKIRNTPELPALGVCGFWKEPDEDAWNFYTV